jgi:hypothetical protein
MEFVAEVLKKIPGCSEVKMTYVLGIVEGNDLSHCCPGDINYVA